MEKHILSDKKEAQQRFVPIAKEAHKGIQGHALIVGGSYGKIGSVSLATKACLKAGAGLVTAYLPKCGYDVMQTTVPEAMVLTDDYNERITSVNHDLQLDAVGFGIGIEQHQDTHQAMFHFLKMNDLPMVIDADGLNILAQNKEWLEMLRPKTILTPHLKELDRLIGEWESVDDMVEKVKAFSSEFDIVVVLKGAPTLIVYKSYVYMNTTGNQGLATAGSGDVLTGIITGLLAQKYDPVDAAILGVYLHGLAADIAVPEMGHHSFIASDIIGYLGKAFLTLGKK